MKLSSAEYFTHILFRVLLHPDGQHQLHSERGRLQVGGEDVLHHHGSESWRQKYLPQIHGSQRPNGAGTTSLKT